MSVLNKFIGVLIVSLLAMCHATSAIGPVIKANSQTGNVMVNSSDPVSITVGMNAADYAGIPVDWWVVASAGSSWYYLNDSMQWTTFDGNLSNCHPVYQGALENLPATQVLNTCLPIGLYTFYFTVDYPMDEILNVAGPILLSSVSVRSTPETVFYDDFSGGSVNPGLWHIPTWVSPSDGTYVGRTQFRCSQNAPLPKVSSGNAIIVVESFNPTGYSFYGTDFITDKLFALGQGQGFDVAVRAKMNNPPPGVVGGIFLYDLKSDGTVHDEIDIELLSNSPDKFNTNIYGNEPLGTGHPQYTFYDTGSANDYHTYEIKWLPNMVSWLVDGNLVRTTTNNVPQGPMHFHVNMWVPDWTWTEAYSADIQPTSSAGSDQVYSISLDWVLITVLEPE